MDYLDKTIRRMVKKEPLERFIKNTLDDIITNPRIGEPTSAHLENLLYKKNMDIYQALAEIIFNYEGYDNCEPTIYEDCLGQFFAKSMFEYVDINDVLYKLSEYTEESPYELIERIKECIKTLGLDYIKKNYDYLISMFDNVRESKVLNVIEQYNEDKDFIDSGLEAPSQTFKDDDWGF